VLVRAHPPLSSECCGVYVQEVHEVLFVRDRQGIASSTSVPKLFDDPYV
jgi:hypothetical protein